MQQHGPRRGASYVVALSPIARQRLWGRLQPLSCEGLCLPARGDTGPARPRSQQPHPTSCTRARGRAAGDPQRAARPEGGGQGGKGGAPLGDDTRRSRAAMAAATPARSAAALSTAARSTMARSAAAVFAAAQLSLTTSLTAAAAAISASRLRAAFASALRLRLASSPRPAEEAEEGG